MSKIGLYLHFPFCRQKCHYCSLFSQAGLEKLIPEYIKALKQDLLSYQNSLAGQEIATIYFGGGTPSLLEADSIGEVLGLVKEKFAVASDAEISLEANPETLNFAKLSQYYKLGINRLSLGLQAWQDQLLVKMGRTAKQQQFIQALAWAKEVGFNNINADLIFGLPEQTLGDWQESLEAVVKADLQHVACYSLEVDERSTWGRLAVQGKFATVSEELDREMARLTKSKLTADGFNQYEISNFARSGYECQHNLNFWHGAQYIGVGAGAHSFFQGYRYRNSDSIPRYIQQMTSGDFSRVEKNYDTSRQARENLFAQQLRLNEGINLADAHLPQQLVQKLLANDLIAINDNRLQLTELGQNLENQVIVELLG